MSGKIVNIISFKPETIQGDSDFIQVYATSQHKKNYKLSEKTECSTENIELRLITVPIFKVFNIDNYTTKQTLFSVEPSEIGDIFQKYILYLERKERQYYKMQRANEILHEEKEELLEQIEYLKIPLWKKILSKLKRRLEC